MSESPEKKDAKPEDGERRCGKLKEIYERLFKRGVLIDERKKDEGGEPPAG
jgi:hypothetical protein